MAIVRNTNTTRKRDAQLGMVAHREFLGVRKNMFHSGLVINTCNGANGVLCHVESWHDIYWE